MMNFNETDWDNAPEGATHYSEDSGTYYKKVGDQYEMLVSTEENEWPRPVHPFRGVRQMIERPDYVGGLRYLKHDNDN